MLHTFHRVDLSNGQMGRGGRRDQSEQQQRERRARSAATYADFGETVLNENCPANALAQQTANDAVGIPRTPLIVIENAAEGTGDSERESAGQRTGRAISR
jgi:hypothetical protein